MKTNVIINLQFEATHYWATIPDSHLESYLKYPHRHVFHIKIKIPVQHNDRDIEFIQYKRMILADLLANYREAAHLVPDIGELSCEMLAVYLLHQWDAVYVSVLEDGENGAEVYRDEYFEREEPHVTGDFI